MDYIDKIKSFIPPLWLYRKNYFLTRKEDVSLPLGKRIFIFLAANYGNLGDIAITCAQHKWLQTYFSSYEIVEVPANCSFSYLKGVLGQVTKEDIITFVGGGNMGDMYPLYENIRQLIVSKFPCNKIIQFPLTADFSYSHEGCLMKQSAQKIYSNHKDITILSREKKTEKFLSDLLNKKINTVPDIVMTLDCLDFALSQRHGVSICLRQDKEKSLSDEVALSINEVLKRNFGDIDSIDTLIDDDTVTLSNKERFLDSFLRKLATKQLMVTDRLHGMIFAYVTGTPAIVFSNSNQKVKYCYEWIKDCGYIFYMEKYDKDSFAEKMNQALRSHVDRKWVAKRKDMFNEMILKAL